MQKIDEKHHIENETIIKTSNGIPIDLSSEPVILFRGRDKLAVKMLEFYRQLCVDDGCTDYQLNSMNVMINRFKDYAEKSPTMKQPGITLGK